LFHPCNLSVKGGGFFFGDKSIDIVNIFPFSVVSQYVKKSDRVFIDGKKLCTNPKKIASPACRGMGPVIVEGERARPHLDALLALADVVVLSVPPGWGGTFLSKRCTFYIVSLLYMCLPSKKRAKCFLKMHQSGPKTSPSPLPSQVGGQATPSPPALLINPCASCRNPAPNKSPCPIGSPLPNAEKRSQLRKKGQSK